MELFHQFLAAEFLEGVYRKFHFGEAHKAQLQAVAEEMLPLMRREAFYERAENIMPQLLMRGAEPQRINTPKQAPASGEELPEQMPALGGELPEQVPAPGEELPEQMPALGEELPKQMPALGEELPEQVHRGILEVTRQRPAAGTQLLGTTAETVYEGVVLSLGHGVDKLQERYTDNGLLLKSYMLEALAAEFLMRGYGAYRKTVLEATKMHVAAYHFPGSEEGFPLEMLPGLLRVCTPRVVCNAAFCMTPQKSVAFIAELTQEPEKQCESICAACRSRCDLMQG